MTRRAVGGALLALAGPFALAACGGAGVTSTKSTADFESTTKKICLDAQNGKTLSQVIADGRSNPAFLHDLETAVNMNPGELKKLAKVEPPASSGVSAAQWRNATEEVAQDEDAVNTKMDTMAKQIQSGLSSDDPVGAVAAAEKALTSRSVLAHAAAATKKRQADVAAWLRLGRKAGLAHACDIPTWARSPGGAATPERPCVDSTQGGVGGRPSRPRA